MIKEKSLKTYRHADNPEEKNFHDQFKEQFSIKDIDRILFDTHPNGEPKEFADTADRVKLLNMVQWLGSPVGLSFLESCGYVKKKSTTLQKALNAISNEQ